VVGDVFAGARTPAHLTSTEFAAEARRVLRAGGVYAANVADGPPLRHARTQVATLRSIFRNVCLLAEPGTMRGRRFGNLVAVASDVELPIDDYVRRCARDPMPARVVHGADLAAFTGSARPVHDATAVDSPEPPDGVFTR
jgi:spermidine synthase